MALATLTCTWGRAPLPALPTPQAAYMLIEASADAAAIRAPLNLCFVLDRSGSMQGAKLAAMKAATKTVIDLLAPDDIVAVVIFDDTVAVAVPAAPLGDAAALKAQIDAISEAGGTAMAGGMQAGRTELQRFATPERAAAMLLLTDGQTWGDEDNCRQIARSLADDGVRVTALGLGAEWNELLLDEIADATGGSSDYIADPAQIGAFFAQSVRRAQGLVAREARLLLRLVRDVAPRAVHRATPVIANLGFTPIGEHEIAVNLGDLDTTAPASLVIDLLLPVRAAGAYRVAQVELQYTPLNGAAETIKQDVMVEVTDDAQAAKFDPRVMNLVEKVTAFKLQTRALAEAEAGNIVGATRNLRAAATRLLDLGELELAQKTQQEAERLEQGATTIDGETRKELRYATRRLTQKLEDPQ